MLTLHDLAALPLPALTCDAEGHELARTPEWVGATVGGRAYGHGDLSILVEAGTECSPPGAAAIFERMVAAVGAACGALGCGPRRRLELVAHCLLVTAGRPIPERGTTAEVVDYLRECLPARAEVRLVVREVAASSVVSPAVTAGALLQLAVNAAEHAGATSVDLRVLASHGSVTYRLEWDGAMSWPRALRTSRSQSRADRTGLAAARVLADAVGGTITGLLPGVDPVTGAEDLLRTRMEMCVGLDELRLPVARVAGGCVVWCTRVWEEEVGTSFRQELPDEISRLVDAAQARPGELARGGAFSARADGARTWLAVPPDGAFDRTLMAARYLEHERALTHAPPPHASRIRSLCHLLMGLLGRDLPYVTGDTWAAAIARECAAYGLATSAPTLDVERILSPMVSAYLLSELGGVIDGARDHVWIEVRPELRRDPLVRLLAADGQRIPLTPT